LKIFEAKERPAFDPLIVHVSHQILSERSGPLRALVKDSIIDASVLNWSSRSKIEALMKRYWPGPLTLILPRGSKIPNEVTSGQNTVGIRVPNHPVFQSILASVDFPLAAPSANRFGRISPTEATHVQAELDGRIAAIVDGGSCEVGVESSILLIKESGAALLLRPGKISAAEFEAILGSPVALGKSKGQENQTQLAPGMLDQHYAPRKPLLLLPDLMITPDELREIAAQFKIQGHFAILSQGPISNSLLGQTNPVYRILSKSRVIEEIAQNLFTAMRDLDHHPRVDFIVADLPQNRDEGLGAAVADRLNRASINKPL
jgi:L-threonylcarbamoyladenylate synthase